MKGTAAACAIVSLLLLGLVQPSPATPEGGTGAAHPELKRLPDPPLLVTGASLLIASIPIAVTRKPVPAAGLDPRDIRWSVDRRVVGKRSTRADSESDYFHDAAVAYPLALSLAFQPSGTRVRGTLQRSIVYLEAVLISEGIASVIKNTADRPRPYTYLPADERPNNRAYDATVNEAFRSMPSGHATISFCGAAFAMADHLISRPEASWEERAGTSFVGGFLAGMTAAMRIQGGQHFPSDAMVGGLLGTACGIAVPLAHQYVDADGRRMARPILRALGSASHPPV